MNIRLGFSGNSKLLNNCPTNKTVSIEAINKIEDNEKKILRLKKVARENILNTLKILENNKKIGIKVYGLSSKLFPLPNYPDIEYFKYIDLLKSELLSVGNFIKDNDFRVNVHLEGTVMLNFLSERLYDDTIRNIKQQNVILNSMGLDEKAKIIVSFGGAYINKEDSIDRFKFTLESLDEAIKKRLVVNNQDDNVDAETVLSICNNYSIPYFLNVDSNIDNELINNGIKSWERENMPALLGLRSNSGLTYLHGLDKNVDVILNNIEKDVNIVKLRNNKLSDER